MNVFSGLKFFAENKKKSVVSFIILSLAVCAITIITILINSIIGTVNDYNVEPYKYFSSVVSKTGEKIDESTILTLEQEENIDKVIKINFNESLVKLIIGGYSRVPVFFADTSDLEYILDTTGTNIKEGRLPKDGSNEVALDWRLMANKDLEVGDTIGSTIDSSEVLIGEYKIVGKIDGDTIISVGSNIASSENGNSGILLFHSEDKADKPLSKLDDKNYEITTRTSKADFVDDNLGSLQTTLIAIIMIVTVILSISIGSLMYIIYLQRNSEFGILFAIGYDMKFIRNMAMKELALINILSWAVGLVISGFIVLGLNIFIYNPQGVTMRFFDIRVLINTILIPIISTFMSITPIVRHLKKSDPISVIERRE